VCVCVCVCVFQCAQNNLTQHTDVNVSTSCHWRRWHQRVKWVNNIDDVRVPMTTTLNNASDHQHCTWEMSNLLKTHIH